MSTLVRRLTLILAIPLLLVLTSCIRMTMDIDIDSPERIDVKADIGMQNAAAKEMGGELPDFCEEAGLSGELDGATTEPYSDEGDAGYTGCRVEGTNTLAEMSSSGGPGLKLEDGIWTFEMEGGDADAEGMSANMVSDFRISVTFPGEVLTHNGTSTVEGTTVTWSNASDLLSSEGLHATARDSGGAGASPGSGSCSGCSRWPRSARGSGSRRGRSPSPRPRRTPVSRTRPKAILGARTRLRTRRTSRRSGQARSSPGRSPTSRASSRHVRGLMALRPAAPPPGARPGGERPRPRRAPSLRARGRPERSLPSRPRGRCV